MNLKSLIANFSVALVAQGTNLLVSFAVSLLLPKILGVEEYGYWQLFILYASYVGLFHLGLNDGVYLIKGGQGRDVIDKLSVNSQMAAGFIFQTGFAVVIVAAALAGGFGEQRVFVLVCTAIYLLLSNMGTYLGYVFQAMNETKLFSASVLINGVVFFVPLLVLLALGITDFRMYVVFYLFSRLCSLAFCLWFGRDFLVAGCMPLGSSFKLAFESIKVGIKLTLANLSGMLIIGIVQFLVDAQWDIATFSTLSLALSMVNFFMAFISNASMVLFPALRQTDTSEQAAFFAGARDLLGLILPAAYLLYIPIVFILGLWLPNYAASFALFTFLLPMCVYDGKMDIVGTTYLKVLRGETTLLKINVVTVACSAVGAFVGTHLLHSVEAAVIAAVVCIMARCLFTEFYLARAMEVSRSSIGLVSVLVTVAFVASAHFVGGMGAFIIFLVVYVAYIMVYRKRFAQALSLLKGSMNG